MPDIRVSAALREAATRLEATSPTARLDAEVLMAFALDASRSDLLLRHMQAPAPAAFTALVERRLAHEPVAYILGTAQFHGLDLIVTPDVLIPRDDSEALIEAARAAFVVRQPARVLDCGTGSGALLLAALAEFPEARGVGIDRSPAALTVAHNNADRTGLADRSEWLLCDWDTPGWSDTLGQFDLILANPPYVEEHAVLETSVWGHEPHGALFAGPEGLDAYRVLIPQLPALLTQGGVAIVEIGYRQAAQVMEIGRLAGLTSQLHHDLAGRPRAVEFVTVD